MCLTLRLSSWGEVCQLPCHHEHALVLSSGRGLEPARHYDARSVEIGRGNVPADRFGVVLTVAATTAPLVVANPWGLDTHALPKALVLAVLAVGAFAAAGISGGWRMIPRSAWGWLAVLLAMNGASLGLSQDWRGSLLGAFQHRHGLVTSVGLLALLFAAACASGSQRQATRRALFVGALGTVVVTLQLFEELEASPGGIVSTFGNRNDIGAVIPVSLAATAIGSPVLRRGGWLLTVAMVIALIASIATESRGAVLATLVTVGALAYGWRHELVAAVARHRLGSATLVMTALLLVAFWPASHRTIGRFGELLEGDRQLAGATSTAIRLDLWRGSFGVFLAHPLVGAGQDTLLSEFVRHRRSSARLDAMEAVGEEPLFASPHNFIVEVLCSFGVLGALVLSGFTIYCISTLRRMGSGSGRQNASLGAGVLGFGIASSVSPVPVAALALATYLLGTSLGAAWSASGDRRAAAAQRMGKARGPVTGVWAGLAIVCVGGVLWADTAAARAVDADRTGDIHLGLSRIDTAVTLVPFERMYRREEVRLLVRASAAGNDVSLERALAACSQYVRDFPGLARDYLQLAVLTSAANVPGADRALADATSASPRSSHISSIVESIAAGRQPKY